MMAYTPKKPAAGDPEKTSPAPAQPMTSSTGTDKINAAGELRWFLNRLRATMAIADDLEKIGSMENALAEGQNSLKSLRQQQDDENAKLSKLKGDVDKAKAEAAEIINKAGQRAKEMTEAVEKDGAKIKADAQAKGEEILTVAAKRAKMVDDETAAKHAELEKLNDEVKKAATKLADINKQLDAVRRKVTA